MRPFVTRDVAYAMQDSVPHLSVSSMVWKSVHVQLRKNFVICVVKRKEDHALQQSVCLRYKVDDWKYGIISLCLGVPMFVIQAEKFLTCDLIFAYSLFNFNSFSHFYPRLLSSPV